MWARPSALQSADYATALREDLERQYIGDCEQAQSSTPPVTIPTRPETANLRIAQWNVHYFRGGLGVSTVNQVFDELNKHNADVIILNEFGSDDPTEHAPFLKRMQKVGYKRYKVAETSYPTVILTRIQQVDRVEDFALDVRRRAVAMRLRIPLSPSTATTAREDNKVDEAQEPRHSRHVWIYGTHLHDYEDYAGRRKDEMQTLLNFHIENNMAKNDPTLIVGDFNQQRPTDYSDEEWNRIVLNKAHRGLEKFTDGVDELLTSHGFACVWDQGTVPHDARNWHPNQPPPATHWTGTVIDYVYHSSRNNDVQNVGAYISPSDLSDHRLIVTDWKIC